MNDAIAKAFPLVMAPVEGTLAWGEQNGSRFIAAREGVVREIVLPWVQARHIIARSELAMPYGSIEGQVNFLCGAIPREMFSAFIKDARRSFPKECAGAFIWSHEHEKWRYQSREPISASGSHIDFKEVHLDDGEHLVVDIHSHAGFRAFFSDVDDKDDFGAMRLSFVIGNIDADLTWETRLCLAGKIFPVSVNAAGEVRAIL